MSKEPTLNEMLKLWTKKDLWERIQHHIKRIDDLQSQLDQQKAMWNELKEFIVEQINFDKEEIEENKEIPNLPNRHYLTIENIILEKMQELQNGDFS